MIPATPPPTAAPVDDPVRAALNDPRTLERLHVGARAILRAALPGASRTLVGQLADDVVSRTIEAALTARFDVARGPSVSAWLFGIARNMVRKETEGRRSCTATAPPVDWDRLVADPAAGPQEQAELRAERERVQAVFAQLAPHERELLGMHYVEGLTAVQIGQRLQASPATVRVRLHRARKAVELALAPSRKEGGS